MSKLSGFVIALGVLAIATGGYLWWKQSHPDVPPAAVATSEAPPEAAAPPAAPAEPQEQYPIDKVAPEADTAVPSGDLSQMLASLVGADALARMVQTADFPRRVVATVDGLGRNYVSPTVWPVNPTPGRFSVSGPQGNEIITASNARRYQPFISMVQAIDTGKLVAVYVKLYPQLQQAYSDLGYPRGHFNDRLVAVLDNLLATPDPADPLSVTLTEVKSDTPNQRPWVRYEYADPRFEAMSAGQRILLRMGADHRKKLKAKLTELRARIAGGAPPG